METPRETTPSVGTAAAVSLCPGDPTRRLLIIGVPVGGAMMVATAAGNLATGVSNKGLSVSATLPLLLTVKDHGLMATLQWFGIASGSPFSAYVMEMFDPQNNYPEVVSRVKRPNGRYGLILPGDNLGTVDMLNGVQGVNTDSLYDRLRRLTGGIRNARR